jgi:hypothetical protein
LVGSPGAIWSAGSIGRRVDARVTFALRVLSHGCAAAWGREEDRHVIATHEGTMPRQLADHAALVMFGLVADADKLCAGEWW